MALQEDTIVPRIEESYVSNKHIKHISKSHKTSLRDLYKCDLRDNKEVMNDEYYTIHRLIYKTK